MIRKNNVLHNGEIDIPHEYFDDFNRGGYVKDLALASESDPGAKFSEVADCGEWLVTVTDGGGDNNNSIAIGDDLANGYVVITNTDADNDLTSCQLNGEAFKLADSKPLAFQAKFRVSDVDAADFFIGLAIADTSILGTTLANGCTDLIGFGCPDATGDLDFIASINSGGTSTDTAVNLADATDVVVRFEWDGVDTVTWFVNGTEIDSTTTSVPTDEALTPTVEIRNAAAAKAISIDYILVEQDR